MVTYRIPCRVVWRCATLAVVIFMAALAGRPTPSLARTPSGGASGFGCYPIEVNDTGIWPSTMFISQGFGVCWYTSGTLVHRLVDRSRLKLYDSGDLQPGSSFGSGEFDDAGSYPYADVDTGGLGWIHVYLDVTPTNGTTSTAFTVRWAFARLPAGYGEDVQILVPGTTITWLRWRRGTRRAQGMYTPQAGPGTYYIRARLRNTSTGKFSRWSPAGIIQISP
jgi:hypothetical protein